MRFWLLATVFSTVTFFSSQQVDAFERAFFAWCATPMHQSYHAGPTMHYHHGPSYAQKYHYLNQQYPKFYGGFHSSYYHNMGIPSGDIGPRGNGIYPTPW